MIQFKEILKGMIPRSILNYFIGFFYGWTGNFSTWGEAEKKSSGYDSQNILEKVKNATLKVKNGLVPYERDSVVFNKIQYSYPLLSGLMWIAAQNNGELNVLDFGGSLGSSYFQNKYFLDSLRDVKWCIVEQENFVNEGLKNFTDKNLKFYNSIEDCLNENTIEVILLSSVLQYIEEPYKLLELIKSKGFDYIIIDRTPFIKGVDRLTIQKVHPAIYKAKYPCWFFNKEKFVNALNVNYKIVVEFDSIDQANIKSEFKGFILKKLV